MKCFTIVFHNYLNNQSGLNKICHFSYRQSLYFLVTGLFSFRPQRYPASSLTSRTGIFNRCVHKRSFTFQKCTNLNSWKKKKNKFIKFLIRIFFHNNTGSTRFNCFLSLAKKRNTEMFHVDYRVYYREGSTTGLLPNQESAQTTARCSKAMKARKCK